MEELSAVAVVGLAKIINWQVVIPTHPGLSRPGTPVSSTFVARPGNSVETILFAVNAPPTEAVPETVKFVTGNVGNENV